MEITESIRDKKRPVRSLSEAQDIRHDNETREYSILNNLYSQH